MKDHYNNHSGSVSNSRHTSSTRHLNHQTEKKSTTSKGKTEWRKTAIRICGDWSEQLSSKAKIYYYNCTTEVSQWQKPKEWSLPELPRQQLIDLYNKRSDKDRDGQAAMKRTHSSNNSMDSKPLRPACLGHGTGSSSDAISPKRPKYSSDTTSLDLGHKQTVYPINNSYSSHSSRQQQNLSVNASNIPVISSSSHHHYDNRYQHHPATAGGSSVASAVSMQQRLSQQHQHPYQHHHTQHVNHHDQPSGVNKSRESVTRGSGFVLPAGMTISNDDMDISPNSSPMSGGSCSPTPPLASAYTGKNNSPSRRRPQQLSSRGGDVVQRNSGNHTSRVGPNNAGGTPMSTNRGQGRPQTTTAGGPGDTQHTLRQMMDNLKDTLTNLLSGRNTSSSYRPPSSAYPAAPPSTGVGQARCPFSHPSNTPNQARQVVNAGINPYLRSLSTPVPGTPTSTQVNSSLLSALSTALSSLCTSSGPPSSTSSGGGDALLSTRQVDELMAKLESVNSRQSSSSPIRPPGPHRQQHNTTLDNNRRGNMFTNRPESQQSGGGGSTSSPQQQADLMRLLQDVIAQTGLQSPAPSQHSSGTAASSTNRESLRALASLLQKGIEQIRASSSPSVTSSPAQVMDRMGLKPNPQSNGHGSEHGNYHHSVVNSSLGTTQRQSLPGEERGNGVPPTVSTSVLDSLDVMQFLDSTSLSRFRDPLGERLEQEAQTEAQKFDKLQTVLYGELSGELKKLRALVRISEVKTSIHQKKKEALDDLMDTIESRKSLPTYINRT